MPDMKERKSHAKMMKLTCVRLCKRIKGINFLRIRFIFEILIQIKNILDHAIETGVKFSLWIYKKHVMFFFVIIDGCGIIKLSIIIGSWHSEEGIPHTKRTSSSHDGRKFGADASIFSKHSFRYSEQRYQKKR